MAMCRYTCDQHHASHNFIVVVSFICQSMSKTSMDISQVLYQNWVFLVFRRMPLSIHVISTHYSSAFIFYFLFLFCCAERDIFFTWDPVSLAHFKWEWFCLGSLILLSNLSFESSFIRNFCYDFSYTVYMFDVKISYLAIQGIFLKWKDIIKSIQNIVRDVYFRLYVHLTV